MPLFPNSAFWRRRSVTRINPPRCLLCSALAQQGSTALCKNCVNELPYLEHACPLCMLPYSSRFSRDRTTFVCGQCLATPPHFDQCIATFRYEQPINALLGGFKYSARLDYGVLLADLMVDRVLQHYSNDSLPDAIVPVPLHWRRLQQRGFNQSDLLARLIQRRIHRQCNRGKLPIMQRLASRPVNTDSQVNMSLAARNRNMHKAFRIASHTIPPRHLAIIDDVMTTGATVNELSRVLKSAGAESIAVWCVARTPLGDTQC